MNNILEGKFLHFTQKELEMGREIPDELYKNIIPTASILDILRSEYDNPIYINSTYRSPEYNQAVGGKTKSLHLVFNAIDWTVKDKKDLKRLYDLLNEWDKEDDKFTFLPKKRGNMGIGLYKTFIHLDTRSTLGLKSPSRWKG